jgi:hypothetical protein
MYSGEVNLYSVLMCRGWLRVQGMVTHKSAGRMEHGKTLQGVRRVEDTWEPSLEGSVTLSYDCL